MNRSEIRISRRALLALAPLSPLALLAGCKAPAQGDVAGRRVKVTATVGMVADTARRVGGERVEVTALMGPGVDPHLYNPSQGDISRLTGADVILYNGLNLEGKMGEIFRKMSGSRPTVAVAEAIERSLLREPPEFQGHPDPHVWFDVSMWAQTIQPVVEALSGLDAGNRSLYEANGEAYRKELLALHEECKAQLATIPKPQRVLITAHDAFGYFGGAYDVEVVALQGISTVSEVSALDVRRLVNLIVDRKIKAVFVESSVARKAVDSVVDGCRSKGHPVKVGGTLFSDAMGEANSPEGTYVGMVRHNVRTIVGALK